MKTLPNTTTVLIFPSRVTAAAMLTEEELWVTSADHRFNEVLLYDLQDSQLGASCAPPEYKDNGTEEVGGTGLFRQHYKAVFDVSQITDDVAFINWLIEFITKSWDEYILIKQLEDTRQDRKEFGISINLPHYSGVNLPF